MAALGSAYRSGHLSTSTFELRVDAALRAKVAPDLRRLLADLPGLTRLSLILRGECELPTAAAVNLVLPGPSASPRLTVGRDSACDVTFVEPTVSRRHASIRRRDGQWSIHDLGSTNGTWVNGERVEHRPIAPGDEVRFGDLAARVV